MSERHRVRVCDPAAAPPPKLPHSVRPEPVLAYDHAAPLGTHEVPVAVYEALRGAPEVMVVTEVAARLGVPLGATAVGEVAHSGVPHVFSPPRARSSVRVSGEAPGA